MKSASGRTAEPTQSSRRGGLRDPARAAVALVPDPARSPSDGEAQLEHVVATRPSARAFHRSAAKLSKANGAAPRSTPPTASPFRVGRPLVEQDRREVAQTVRERPREPCRGAAAVLHVVGANNRHAETVLVVAAPVGAGLGEGLVPEDAPCEKVLLVAGAVVARRKPTSRRWRGAPKI